MDGVLFCGGLWGGLFGGSVIGIARGFEGAGGTQVGICRHWEGVLLSGVLLGIVEEGAHFLDALGDKDTGLVEVVGREVQGALGIGLQVDVLKVQVG